MAPRAPVAETGDDLPSRMAGFAPLADRQEGIVMTDDKKTGSTGADEDVVVVAATVADDGDVRHGRDRGQATTHSWWPVADDRAARDVYEVLLTAEIDGSLHTMASSSSTPIDGRIHVDKMTEHSTRTGPRASSAASSPGSSFRRPSSPAR
jgi:hypothetical protein